MKFGLTLPHAGPHASPESLGSLAESADQLGYDSLWTFDRLLYPTHPQTPYPGSPDGKLPALMQHMFDPLVTLSYLAARTTKIRLGTGVLVTAFRSPVLTARMAATLDHLSHGRFICGMGLGWSKDEYDASGVPFDHKGARFNEYLEVLRAVWAQPEAEYKGQFYSLPRSILQPRPVQQPLPLWIGGESPAALQRAVRYGNGWYGAGFGPVEHTVGIAAQLRQQVQQAGRDPKDFAIGLWLPFGLTDSDTPMSLVGTPGHILRNIARYQEGGVTELVLRLQNPADLQRFAHDIRPQVKP